MQYARPQICHEGCDDAVLKGLRYVIFCCLQCLVRIFFVNEVHFLNCIVLVLIHNTFISVCKCSQRIQFFSNLLVFAFNWLNPKSRVVLIDTKLKCSIKNEWRKIIPEKLYGICSYDELLNPGKASDHFNSFQLIQLTLTILTLCFVDYWYSFVPNPSNLSTRCSNLTAPSNLVLSAASSTPPIYSSLLTKLLMKQIIWNILDIINIKFFGWSKSTQTHPLLVSSA